MKIWRTLPLAAVLMASVWAAGSAWAASGRSPIPHPPANVTPTYQAVCGAQGYGSPGCQTAIVSAMNNANRQEGGLKIVLPPNYRSLTPAQQLFVITNLNRLAFRLPPVPALSADANRYALQGAKTHTDPVVPGVLSGGQVVYGWGSNWAEDANVLAADFDWMYDDGIGSGNLDCYATHPAGCWGHRDNILTDWNRLLKGAGWQTLPAYTLTAGAASAAPAAGSQNPSMAYEEIVAAGKVPAVFTWQAVLKSYPHGEKPVTPFDAVQKPPANGTVVRWRRQAYIVEQGILHLLPNAEVEASWLRRKPAVHILNSLAGHHVGVPSLAPFHTGTLVRPQGQSATYLVVDGVLRPVTVRVAVKLGFSFRRVIRAGRPELYWPVGAPMAATPAYVNGELLQFSNRRETFVFWGRRLHRIPNAVSLQDLGGTVADLAHVPHLLSGLTVGAVYSPGKPWLSDGTILRDQGRWVLVSGHQLHLIANRSVLSQLGAVRPQEFPVAKLPPCPGEDPCHNYNTARRGLRWAKISDSTPVK